ncbi:hypothetical protein [Silvimonas sp.]|uniref:hypothetical protein n=1 Tax=Silvimonas sp. TaxID=2650811 RepID=UPI00283C288E|nr:hypothetical protein [Silvimonas sp.]MDR3426257.1 hypothetical protein [Silvimonas sp.]
MYILLIGYLYVILMIAVGTGSVALGGAFILFLGVLPTWLIFWLKRGGQIKKAEKCAEQAQDQRLRDEWEQQNATSAEPDANPLSVEADKTPLDKS